MITAFRWAAIWAILMFLVNCAGRSHETVTVNKPQYLKRKVSRGGEWNPESFRLPAECLTTRPSRPTGSVSGSDDIRRKTLSMSEQHHRKGKTLVVYVRTPSLSADDIRRKSLAMSEQHPNNQHMTSEDKCNVNNIAWHQKRNTMSTTSQ